MFKFNFDVASEEKEETEENKDSGKSSRAEVPSVPPDVEAFREVLPTEAPHLPEGGGDQSNLIIETLGVKHFTGPLNSEEDTLIEQTDRCHSDLLPRVSFLEKPTRPLWIS